MVSSSVLHVALDYNYPELLENSWLYDCAPRELTGKNKVGTVRLLNMEIIIIIKLTNKKRILNKMCGFFQCNHMTL